MHHSVTHIAPRLLLIETSGDGQNVHGSMTISYDDWADLVRKVDASIDEEVAR